MPPPPLSGGAAGNKGSQFATAAKVLFDSAQKVGAVKPIESHNKMYAYQLQKIQNQSKKRGGSLGGVSYKVAEFLATQRTPASSVGPLPRPNTRTMARRVPLLDIPVVKPKAATATAAAAAPAQPEREEAPTPVASPAPPPEVPLLHIPTLATTTTTTPTVASPSSVEDGATVEAAASSTAAAAQTSLAEETSTETTVEPLVPDVLITEDRPMFEIRAPQGPSTEDLSPTVTIAIKPAVNPVRPILARAGAAERREPVQSIVSPLATNGGAAADAALAATTVRAETYSVDSWEQQREREIERLRQRKQEEESQRLATVREEEHRTLGMKWLQARTAAAVTRAPKTDEEKLSHAIAATLSVVESLDSFQKMLSLGARSANAVASAAWSITNKLIIYAGVDKLDLRDRFLDLLDKSVVSATTKSSIKLRFAAGDEMVTQYDEIDVTVRQKLERPQVKKLVGCLVANGQWEEAIRLVEQSRTYMTDTSGVLERGLLSGARGLEAGPKAEVVAYVTRSLTATGRMGKDAKLELALMEAGTARWSLLTQLSTSSEADERVFAEIIKRTSSDRVSAVLEDVARRGLDTEDPVILEAVMLQKVGGEDVTEVFREIERQAPKIGLQYGHLRGALVAVKMSPTKDVLRAAVKVAKQLPETRPSNTLMILFPYLFANDMFSEIAELVDVYSKYVLIPRMLPNEVAYANEALVKLGREPLSATMLKDVNVLVPEAGVRTGDSHTARGAAHDRDAAAHARASTGTAGGGGSGDLSSTTETMLSFAKDRQWAKALGVLETLSDVPETDAAGNSTAAALTLLYNCALSAAVDSADVVLSVYALMKEREIAVNPTTVNTVLSALSRSPKLEEAVPFFDATSIEQRDMNTYLVMVSLLGKRNKWEKAVEVFDEMKKSNPKPPTTMYAVAIGTVANHSWTDALRMFQDMLKIHGGSVKDSVVNQVIRCLEQNGKTAEIAKLEKEIQKKRKKKK